MGKKAVVLGGGGSRGSYQVGVWKALLELGFDYEIVTGTSVGALNGALMVQKDYELAARMWQKLRTRDVMDIAVTDKVENRKDFTGKIGAFITEMVKKGGADPRPLEQMLRAYIDEEKLRNSEVEFGFVTVEYPRLEPKVLTKETVPDGEMVDYLMASAACFPAMKARVIDGKTYIDGGYSDNVPVKMAVEMGADDIVAVDLEAIGVVRKMDFPKARLRYLKSRWDLGIFLRCDRQEHPAGISGNPESLWKAGRLPVYLFAWGNNFAAPAGGKTIGSSAGQKWIVPDSGKCLSGAGQGTAKAAAAFGSAGGAHCRKRYCTGLL